jgi:hypothetical protein
VSVHLDDEPLVDEGEPASVAGRGCPTIYECKDQVEIWRRPDQAYELKIDHTVQIDLSTDVIVSVVDAEAIILFAIADAHDFQGDQRLADIARARAEERMTVLIRANHNHDTVNLGAGYRARARSRGFDYIPDSGSWPSVVPS